MPPYCSFFFYLPLKEKQTTFTIVPFRTFLKFNLWNTYTGCHASSLVAPAESCAKAKSPTWEKKKQKRTLSLQVTSSTCDDSRQPAQQDTHNEQKLKRDVISNYIVGENVIFNTLQPILIKWNTFLHSHSPCFNNEAVSSPKVQNLCHYVLITDGLEYSTHRCEKLMQPWYYNSYI